MVSCKKWHSISAAVHKVRLEYISFLRLCVPFEVNDFYNRQRFWSWTIWTDFWEGFRFGFFGFPTKKKYLENFLGFFLEILKFSCFRIFSLFLEVITFFKFSQVLFFKFSSFSGNFHIFFNFSYFLLKFITFSFGAVPFSLVFPPFSHYIFFFFERFAQYLWLLTIFSFKICSFFPSIPINLTKKLSFFYSFKKSRSNQKHRQYHQELALPLKHWTYQLSVWKRKCTAPL